MIYARTDRGIVRDSNEDNVEVFTCGEITYLMVLDGMGGHNRGDTASSLAMNELKKELTKKENFHSVFSLRRFILRAIKKANRAVNELGSTLMEYADMGTTLVLTALIKDLVLLFNVGDSRCYAMKEGKMRQISEDQTYVEFLYKTGKITFEEKKTHPKRHVLMNALGTYSTISIATKILRESFDKILLCSDGLYNMVDDEYIERILKKDGPIKEKVDELIELSNLNGGKDNIAVALWEADR